MSTGKMALASLALLVVFVCSGLLNVHAKTARDRAWARVVPHQPGTPEPSPSPEPPPVVCPTCPPPPEPHDAMMDTDSVFQCTVAEIVNLGPDGDWHYRVTCPVERYWTAGSPMSPFYVPWSVWECGRVFQPGEQWLVYANDAGKGRSVIGHCDRTKLYSDEEARQLGSSCTLPFPKIDVKIDGPHVSVGERFEVSIDFIKVRPVPERVHASPAGLVEAVIGPTDRVYLPVLEQARHRAQEDRVRLGNRLGAIEHSDDVVLNHVLALNQVRFELAGDDEADPEAWRKIGDSDWTCIEDRCGSITMVARRPGTVRIGVSVYTEVCGCYKGQWGCGYSGVSGFGPPVVISNAFDPVYIPRVERYTGASWH